jgi:hypothetical protein
MSKGYTINYFVTALKNVSATTVARQGVYNTVSPRFGSASVKSCALDYWLGYNTDSIVRGSGRFASYGKTARARLLTALRNRKTTGSVYG